MTVKGETLSQAIGAGLFLFDFIFSKISSGSSHWFAIGPRTNCEGGQTAPGACHKTGGPL